MQQCGGLGKIIPFTETITFMICQNWYSYTTARFKAIIIFNLFYQWVQIIQQVKV